MKAPADSGELPVMRGGAIPWTGPARRVPRSSLRPTWLLPWMIPVVLMLRVYPLPIEEVRVLAVAWEMWDHGEFLVPHLNGLPYSHKPPGLYWLIHTGWAVFGVEAWWPRLVASAGSLCSLALAVHLARRFWAGTRAAAVAPWILAGTAGWVVLTPAIMYDTWLTAAVLAGLSGLVIAADGRGAGWLLYALALAAGLLTKGPVVLLHLLPAAAFAPMWLRGVRPSRWNAQFAAATALGVALVLLWAVPAALRGGEAYASEILWSQSAGRVVRSFAHQRPWWWYGPVLFLLLLPWSAWPAVWRGLRRLVPDAGVGWLLSWILPALLILWLISGKQPQYLLPLVPGIALIASRALEAVPTRTVKRVGLAGTLLTTAALGLAVLLTSESYDVRPVAERLQALERSGAPIAHVGAYHGQFHFAGRLHHDFHVLRTAEASAAWANAHPGGWIIGYRHAPPPATADDVFARRYRGCWVWLTPAAGGARRPGPCQD